MKSNRQSSHDSAARLASVTYEPASGQLRQMQQSGLNTGYQTDQQGRITRKSQNVGGN
jgi:hypothetical protein